MNLICIDPGEYFVVGDKLECVCVCVRVRTCLFIFFVCSSFMFDAIIIYYYIA